MSNIQHLRREIEQLEPTEREELAAWVVYSSPQRAIAWMSGVESTPGICGGEPRILRTRIPAWILERMRQLGMTEAAILKSYPTLRAEDLVHAWAYVDLHRQEIAEQTASMRRIELGEVVCERKLPFPVVDALRELGHDVLTVQETGRANQSVSDNEVLRFAVAERRGSSR